MPKISKVELNIGLEHGRADGEERVYDTPEAILTRALYCVNTATDYLNASMITGLRVYEGDGEAGVAVAYAIDSDDESEIVAIIEKLCSLLGQEAIAVRYYAIYQRGNETRERWREKLIGPKAEEWGPFNAAFFVKP